MAIFPKNGPDRAAPRSDAPAGESGMSIIAIGMKVTGDLSTPGIIKIEGTVEGSIRGARQLLLGRQGIINGDIRAGEVVLGGTVNGTVYADERVEIEGTASVLGDIHTRTIVVHEGGRINGAVRMNIGDAAPAAIIDETTPARGGIALSS